MLFIIALVIKLSTASTQKTSNGKNVNVTSVEKLVLLAYSNDIS